MRRWIRYFAGGMACLGVGATFYIVGCKVPTPPQVQQAISAPWVATVNEPVPEPKPVLPPLATIFFAGDIMLGRDVAAQIAKNGKDYPFAKIKNIVSAADQAVANLEGPFTDINNSPANSLVFHFDPALVAVLAAAGFDSVSLASNHGSDQGAQGVADTKRNLTAANIGYFGDSISYAGPVLELTAHDRRFKIIGIQAAYRHPDQTVVTKEIKAAKNDGAYVIVYPHWGEEFQHQQNQQQIALAHAVIDAGADLVVGSHPHVIQGIEIYKNKPIFYSLGNLIFDQYFSVETQEGLAVRLNVGPDGKASFDLLPFETPFGQPVFAEGYKKAKMLQDIASWSDPALKDQIESGQISLK